MKLPLFLWIVFLCHSAAAKQLHGRVTDEQNRPLALVIIKNLNSTSIVASDSTGYFAIEVTAGDRIMVSHVAHQPYYFTAEATEGLRLIRLQPKDVQLGEVEIHSPMAKFKRDSALNHLVYRKELGYAKSKTKTTVGAGPGTVGVTFDGIFSELALRASGKKKRFKHFAAVMAAEEQQRYISIRYNPGVVTQVTGLCEDDAANFINNHPVSYDFARVASDLELKSWILHEYRHTDPK